MKSFNQAEERVVASLVRMNAPEMRPLLEFFNSLLEDTKEALIAADAEKVVRLQGRAGVLKEFLAAVDHAPVALEKLRKQ